MIDPEGRRLLERAAEWIEDESPSAELAREIRAYLKASPWATVLHPSYVAWAMKMAEAGAEWVEPPRLTPDEEREFFRKFLRKPVCTACGDTHLVYHRGLERDVMCTRCPTPCQECREGGTGAFCGTTPCACACHKARA